MMQGYPQFYYDPARELYQTRLEVAQMQRNLQEHLMVTRETLALARRNHELLTLIYQRNFGAYPLGY